METILKSMIYQKNENMNIKFLFKRINTQINQTRQKLKIIVCLICFIAFLFPAFADTSQVITNAVKTGTIESAISYIKNSLPAVQDVNEQKAIMLFLANLQQQSSLYKDAYESYSVVIALDKTVPNVKVRLDAAMCLLASGETATAESVLDSVLAIESEDSYGAKAKLLAVWCGVLKASSLQELETPVNHFFNFLNDPVMECVKPSVLFSLWWLTGDAVFAQKLETDFATTPEAACANGRAEVLPLPYFYFVPRKNSGFDAKKAAERYADKKAISEAKAAENQKIVWQQVGLFRDETNAENCMKRLLEAGFMPEVLKQTKASGNNYTAVVVRETDGSVAQALRNAGFECYPIFEE